ETFPPDLNSEGLAADDIIEKFSQDRQAGVRYRSSSIDDRHTGAPRCDGHFAQRGYPHDPNLRHDDRGHDSDAGGQADLSRVLLQRPDAGAAVPCAGRRSGRGRGRKPDNAATYHPLAWAAAEEQLAVRWGTRRHATGHRARRDVYLSLRSRTFGNDVVSLSCQCQRARWIARHV